MYSYRKKQQVLRQSILDDLFDSALLDTMNKQPPKKKEEKKPTTKKKRYEKTVITEGVDVLETDRNTMSKLKTSGFLLTLNTNKNKAIINTELLRLENNDDGDYGYQELCKKLEAHVIRKLNKKNYYIPKMYGCVISDGLWTELREFIVQLHVEPGAWEESSESNGRKIHIHITARVMYSGMFMGYFHIDTKKLGESIRKNVPELNWGRGPYMMVRFIKEANLTVAQYIHKLKYSENITLYEKTAERIAEYKERREQIENLKLDI